MQMDNAAKNGWHRADIMAAVRKAGSSFAAIGRSQTPPLKRQSMYWATITPHPRANKAIADFIGVSLHELWPHWFDLEGKLISTQALPRRPDRITRGSHPARVAGRRAA